MQHKFIADQNGEVINGRQHFILEKVSLLDVTDEISKVTAGTITADYPELCYMVLGSYEGNPILVHVINGSENQLNDTLNGGSAFASAYAPEQGFDTNCIELEVSVTGHRDAIKALQAPE
jgi:hypothetical protein